MTKWVTVVAIWAVVVRKSTGCLTFSKQPGSVPLMIDAY